MKKLEWPISLHVDKLLELYIVDQLSEAEVNGAPHPRVHPSSPHASEDRSVVVRVVPFKQNRALEEERRETPIS